MISLISPGQASASTQIFKTKPPVPVILDTRRLGGWHQYILLAWRAGGGVLKQTSSERTNASGGSLHLSFKGQSGFSQLLENAGSRTKLNVHACKAPRGSW